MNSNTDYSDITIASTMAKCVASHIDEDIILFEELAKLPFPTEPRRMGCIFVGLCLQGTIRHEVNTAHRHPYQSGTGGGQLSAESRLQGSRLHALARFL